MTRHDPFSYGQVRFDQKGASAETPDELLFVDAGPPRRAGAADPDWSLPEADAAPLGDAASDGAALQFGADVLGEDDPAAGGKASPSRSATATAVAPAPAAARTVAPEPAVSAASAAGLRLPQKQRLTVSQDLPALPARLSCTLVPAAFFACGGTAAAWFYAMEQNVVMASIVGALAIVGAAFARVWLRR